MAQRLYKAFISIVGTISIIMVSIIINVIIINVIIISGSRPGPTLEVLDEPL